MHVWAPAGQSGGGREPQFLVTAAEAGESWVLGKLGKHLVCLNGQWQLVVGIAVATEDRALDVRLKVFGAPNCLLRSVLETPLSVRPI